MLLKGSLGSHQLIVSKELIKPNVKIRVIVKLSKHIYRYKVNNFRLSIPRTL